MSQSNNWVWSYLIGVSLFSFGMGFQFGWGGLAIALGAIMAVGGFGEFILVKVQKIVATQPPAERATQDEANNAR